MPVPLPKEDLGPGSCAVVHSDTLYVLSATSFQSLPLRKGAKWSKEKVGVPVDGAACLTVGEWLYVVGGKTTNRPGFSGLQRYSFADRKWKSFDTPVPVLAGRTHHSVAYLSDSHCILSYAGSQPDAPSFLSSQTFTIDIENDHTVDAYTSKAPTAHGPILSSLNSSHAVMLGGSEINNEIWTFGPNNWQRFPVDLPEPLAPSVRGVVLDGDDGSKVVEAFHLEKSPTTVERIVLLGANGRPFVGRSRKRKRDLTLADWPDYNSTNAPPSAGSDSAIAYEDGLVVVAGDDSESPVALFDPEENSWLDPEQFFTSQQTLRSDNDTSSSTISTSSTSASTPTETGSIAGSDADNDHVLRILGISLGALCGVAVLFIIALLFFKYQRMQKREREGGYVNEKWGCMGFPDRTPSEPKPPARAMTLDRYGSRGSVAILGAKLGQSTRRNSSDSTAHLVDRDDPVEMDFMSEKHSFGDRKLVQRPAGSADPRPSYDTWGGDRTDGIIKATLDAAFAGPGTRQPNPSVDRQRSSGWSKYFASSGSGAPDAGRPLPPAHITSRAASGGSLYSDPFSANPSNHPSGVPSSGAATPLDVQFAHNIHENSPRLAPSPLVTHGHPTPQAGVIVQPSSRGDDHSSFNSNLTGEGYFDAPPDTLADYHTKRCRAPSSTYSCGKSVGFFPGAGTGAAYRPSSRGTAGGAPSFRSGGEPTDMQTPPTLPSIDRDSTFTVFPGPGRLPGKHYGDQNDLAWINLNDRPGP